jgi:hypothetical protein
LDRNYCDEDKGFEMTIFCMGSLVGFYVVKDLLLAEKLFSRLKRHCHALCVVLVHGVGIYGARTRFGARFSTSYFEKKARAPTWKNFFDILVM